MDLPYRIAVLCYLYDEAGRLLLLHRVKAPNRDLYSPIGGKLDMATGESPTACAIREIREEAGVEVNAADLHLVGVVSEASFEGQGHWLMFMYEVTRPVAVATGVMREGRLEWHAVSEVESLNIPATDRQVIWPEYLRHRGSGFFMTHIECADPSRLRWSTDQSRR